MAPPKRSSIAKWPIAIAGILGFTLPSTRVILQIISVLAVALGVAIVLFECMTEADVKTPVFSSSATVYGEPAAAPIHEEFPLSAASP